eukprot:scaffold71158_cov19-Tisochrysis_lutea.AAC.1
MGSKQGTGGSHRDELGIPAPRVLKLQGCWTAAVGPVLAGAAAAAAAAAAAVAVVVVVVVTAVTLSVAALCGIPLAGAPHVVTSGVV